jgi:fumarate hydratase class II
MNEQPGHAPTRLERDTLGEVQVPLESLWGAQTQRALEFFDISTERAPPELIHALALVKRACAVVNLARGLLSADKAQAIVAAADEVLAGRHGDAFVLSLWQTGSGTQTHMNLNEVLANRASELMGGERGLRRRVHPNDEVNRSQSSNDVFPTALHVAAAQGLRLRLLPALEGLAQALEQQARTHADLLKVGRTHLQDATPVTLGQEFSGYAAQLVHARRAIEAALPHLLELALGGTAVGTGLNAPEGFGEQACAELARLTGLPCVSAPNKFEALAASDAIVHAHGALKGLAASLMKIANDIRWLASGPRCGLGELSLPENEPGSSIMPGKVNPTQSEALAMVCCQVFGNDVAINFGGASGNFELNVYRPLLAHNFLQSLRLLADAMRSFETHCVRGLQPRPERMAELLARSLMQVTALTPHIGYDQAARIAKAAHRQGLGLREAALASGLVSGPQFDAWVDARRMTRPG